MSETITAVRMPMSSSSRAVSARVGFRLLAERVGDVLEQRPAAGEADKLAVALGQRDDRILGTTLSLWRQQPREGLDFVVGRTPPPAELHEAWEWIRNPLPPAGEDHTFEILRKALALPE